MERQNLSLFLKEDCFESPKLTLVGENQPLPKQPLQLNKQMDDGDYFDTDSQFGQCVRSGMVVIHVGSRRSTDDNLIAEIDAEGRNATKIPTSRKEIAELKRAYENRGTGYLVTPTIGFGPLGDMLTRLWLESRGNSTDPPSAA